jgi:Tol biopolymer transport system component
MRDLRLTNTRLCDRGVLLITLFLFGLVLASCTPGEIAGEPSEAATRVRLQPTSTASFPQTLPATAYTIQPGPATAATPITPTLEAGLTPIPSPRATPSAKSLILAVAADDDRYDLYLLSADGSYSVDLTNSPEYESGPSWSPDFQRIAFISSDVPTQVDSQTYQPGQDSLYMVNVDGTGLTNLTERMGVRPHEATPLRWSHDGRNLAFVGEVGSGRGTFIVNTEGARLQPMSTQFSDAYFLCWSLDDQRIYYETLTDTGTALVEASLSDSQSQRMVANEDHALKYALSPDQTKIAASIRDFEWVVGIKPTDYGEWALIPNPDRASGMPFTYEVIWSPDGSRLAFVVQYINRLSSIFVVKSDGTDLRRLEDIPFFDYDPPVYWFQDSRRLAYMNASCPPSATECNWAIRVADVDSGEITILDEHLNGYFIPVLSPDGEQFLLIGDGEGEGGLYVLNADGSGIQRILDRAVRSAVWAPCGSADR